MGKARQRRRGRMEEIFQKLGCVRVKDVMVQTTPVLSRAEVK